MERRNRSLEVLEELAYADSLIETERAPALQRWAEKYLTSDFLENIDLTTSDLKKLSELFYKNVLFLKQQKDEIKEQLNREKDIKKFFN